MGRFGGRFSRYPSHIPLTALGKRLRETLPRSPESPATGAKSVATAILAATVEATGSLAGLLTAGIALFALVTGADISPLVQLLLGATAIAGTWFTFFLAGPRALFHFYQARLLRMQTAMGRAGAQRAPPTGTENAAVGDLLGMAGLKELLAGIRVDFADLTSGVVAEAVGRDTIRLDVGR